MNTDNLSQRSTDDVALLADKIRLWTSDFDRN